jgi:methyl-accepting chemotaxis protein
MRDTCFALLDACPGALCLGNPESGVLHMSPGFSERFPTVRVGMGWPECLTAMGAQSGQQLRPGARFTVGQGARLNGIQVSPVAGGVGEMWLLSATAIAAQQALGQGLNRLLEGVAGGCLDGQLVLPEGTGMAQRVGDAVNGMLRDLRGQIAEIGSAVDALAGCDLRVRLDGDADGELGRLRTRLSVTIANLTESIRQTLKSSKAIAGITEQVASENQLLAERTSAQAQALQGTSANMEQLGAAVANAAAGAESADRQGRQTMQLAESGREAVHQVVKAMESINRGAGEVGEIIGVINDIAFQTNILALNAAVEAARAGEHGRGFAIVAAEVRALAGRSAAAANQIRILVERSGDTAAEGKRLAQDADCRMREILDGVQTTSEQVAAISTAAREQTRGIDDANQALRRIDELTQQNNELVKDLAANSRELDRQARYLTEAAGIFHLPDDDFSHPLHREAGAASQEAAALIGRVLEQAIANGTVDEQRLFDYRYTEIAGTDPLKHSTPYDALADRLFPPVQEALLERHPAFVYAISADFHGYVPTHNVKFSQPLTGDYQTDLAGNRTKRIFSDRVGQQVGRHTQGNKLQTYRRDTGELMFDMSTPIHVNGRHWGGFRIGYRIE